MQGERRRGPRKAVEIDVLFRYWPFDFMCGRVRNVSAAGLFVELERSAVPLYVPVELVFLEEGSIEPPEPIAATVVHTTPTGVGLKLVPGRRAG